MKYKELTTKSEAEVKKMLEDMAGELHKLRQNVRQSQEKQTHKLGALRKDIARIKTFLAAK